MTLEDLKVFVAACEIGNLSALARQLDRSQSAVSQHIARLEKELGAPLLERNARGVTPTEAGVALKELALEGLDSIEVGLKRVREIRDGEIGSLTVTTGGTTVRHFLRGAVVDFRKRHPAVNIQFLPASSSRRCFEILRLNQADLAFVTIGEDVRGITEFSVARQHFYLLVAAEHALAGRKRIKLKDIPPTGYLGLSEGTSSRGAMEQAAAEHGVVLTPEIVFDDFDTASIFVELGLGHAIVPAVQAHNFTQGAAVKAVLVSDLAPVTVGWAYRHWSHLAAPAKDFVGLFQKELKKMRDFPGVEILNENVQPD